jgi:Ca2+-binding EF-hand superfamily protein
LNEIINQVDLDHDGKVSFDEFVVMLDLKQTQEKV